MMRTTIKVLGGLCVVLVISVITGALAFGVPAPPTITTSGVPRVSWMPILRDAGEWLRGLESATPAAWMPDDSGLLVWAPYRVVDQRLHVLSEPGARPRILRAVPRVASVAGVEPGRPYAILAWDSDGTEAFQLYRWDLDDRAPTRLTDGRERAAFGAFEPGGTRFAFVSNRRNGTDLDVFVADPLHPGSEVEVFRGSGSWAVLDWSPVTSVLLLLHVRSAVDNELVLLELETGATRRLSGSPSDPVAHGAARFSRDGRAVYLVSDRQSDVKRARRIELASGEETVLTPAVSWDVEGLQESGDGSTLLLQVNEDGLPRTVLLDVASGRLRALDLFAGGTMHGRLHPARRLLLLVHRDDHGVARTYTYDLDTHALVRWTGRKAPEADGRAGHVIRYPTFDRVDGRPRTIPAFVYPAEGAGPHPVLIDIHGGPEAQARYTTRHRTTQRRGVTVIAPNVRGSTGYGRTYSRLDDGRLREDAVRDIGALLDWIAQQPDLNPERVAVTGGSYGGYMVLASLVHFGDRLRCGVDVVGISNFVTFLENTAPYRRDLRRAEYGDERDPEMRAFLESISPLNHADRITSQLLVVQGANDPRVPVTESRQMVDRVRETRAEVAYIEAADEGHGFRKPWNALYARSAQAELIGECLGG